MNAPPILQRHPALRWLLPIGIAGIAGVVATGALGSSAPRRDSLPQTSPAALIAGVQNPKTDGFAGTVVTHLSLGLPELPAGAGDDASFVSMLSGSHTLQVWYGGADRQRIALQSPTEETDLFRDGRQVWEYSSADRSAVHAVLPARTSAQADSIASAVPTMVPDTLARAFLDALEPTTRVQVDTSETVADRPAYDLVLTPRTDATKIGRVRISVDGQTKVPLAVQVYPRGDSAPAIDVGFTSITFGHQADRNFRFEPPSGATVRQVHPGQHRSAHSAHRAGTATRSGSGWTSVVTARPGTTIWKALRALRSSLTPVHGTWGKGYLLDSALFSALLTKDGRLLVGAVPPETLYAAAGRK